MFPQVERPHQPTRVAPRILLERYRSIGHFYEHVKKGRVAPDCIAIPSLLTTGLRTFIGIEALCPEGDKPCALFRHNHDKQFGDKEIFMGSGRVTVTDRASGLAALEKIVVQGEGASPDDPKSHYNIFQHFLKEHETSPWKHYDYLEDPKTAKYESTPLVHKVRLTTYYTVLQCSYLRTALSRLRCSVLLPASDHRSNLVDEQRWRNSGPAQAPRGQHTQDHDSHEQACRTIGRPEAGWWEESGTMLRVLPANPTSPARPTSPTGQPTPVTRGPFHTPAS